MAVAWVMCPAERDKPLSMPRPMASIQKICSAAIFGRKTTEAFAEPSTSLVSRSETAHPKTALFEPPY
jgi:hypothetical protein